MSYNNCRYPLISSSVYGLNKSHTKLLVVGLSNQDSDNFEYEPVVYLCNSHFVGFKFDLENWKIFKTKFDSVEKYFTKTGKDGKEFLITCGEYLIELGRLFQEKSIVIYKDTNDDRDDGEPPSKKLRGQKKEKYKYSNCLGLKRISFEYLKTISKCVDSKLEYLKKIKRYPTTVVEVTGQMVKEELQNNYSAQYTYYPNQEIKRVLFGAEETDLISRVKEKINTEEVVLEDNIVAIILNEVIILNTDSIALFIQTKLLSNV